MLKINVKYNVCLTNYSHLPLHAERYDTVYIDAPSFTTSEIERIISERDGAMQGKEVSIISVERIEERFSGKVQLPEEVEHDEIAHNLLIQAIERGVLFRLGMMGFVLLSCDSHIPLQSFLLALRSTVLNMNLKTYVGREQK